LKSAAILLLLVCGLIQPAQADICNTEAQNKQAMVRELLSDVAKRGLRGKHYYSITFQTAANGVQLPPQVAARFPDQTTIILQYQFERLNVGPDRFEVVLWFGGKRSKVTVPFNAITLLVDPSVNARIEFDPASRGTSCRSSHLIYVLPSGEIASVSRAFAESRA
jgi:hypothetical protein